MKLADGRNFIIIGENVHTTRVILRNGKLMTTAPDGSEAVRFTSTSGETRYLVIPEALKRTQTYEEGRIKHVAVAVRAAKSGIEPAASDGMEYIRMLVARQLKTGADYLDLNVDEVSLRLAEQKETIQWLVRTVEPMATVPLCVDSSNMEIIQTGLEACEGRAGRPMLNSASLERIDALDLARKMNLPVVATAAGEKGMPENDDQRVANASRMVDGAVARGIPLSDIFVDALVFPISVDSRFGIHCLEAIRRLRATYGPEIHITGGLSNVSFGLPCRKLINDVFVKLAIDAGADSGIIDPVAGNPAQAALMTGESPGYRLAEDVLLGSDRNCKNFLRAYRKGELQPALAG